MSTMSVSTSSSSVQAMSGGGRHHRGGGVLDTAAKALGMSRSDLMSELKSGKSLGDVADEKGVSRDDLASALKAGMPDKTKNSDKADEIVGKIIDQVGMPKGPRGPQGPPPPPPADDDSSTGVNGTSLTSAQQSTLDKLSTLLGTDSKSLYDSLKSGASLSDMLTSKGVSEDKLANVVQDGLLIDAQA